MGFKDKDGKYRPTENNNTKGKVSSGSGKDTKNNNIDKTNAGKILDDKMKLKNPKINGKVKKSILIGRDENDMAVELTLDVDRDNFSLTGTEWDVADTYTEKEGEERARERIRDDLENEPLQDFAVRGLDLLETSGYVPMGYEPEPILDPSSKRLMQLRVDFETNLDVVLQDTDHEDIKVRQTAHRAYRRIAEILKIEGKRISTKDSSLQPITFSSLLDKEFNDPNIRERYGKAFAGLDNAYSGMEAMGSWLYLED